MRQKLEQLESLLYQNISSIIMIIVTAVQFCLYWRPYRRLGSFIGFHWITLPTITTRIAFQLLTLFLTVFSAKCLTISNYNLDSFPNCISN